MLRLGDIGGDPGDISGGGFRLLEVVKGEVADDAGDEEAGNGDGGRAKGKLALLVKNTARVMTRGPL